MCPPETLRTAHRSGSGCQVPQLHWVASTLILDACFETWEGCNCAAQTSAAQWRERIVQQRQQASLAEALAGEPLPLEQHIAAAAERLRNEIAKMTQKTARKFARALCVPQGDKSTTQDELRKLQATTTALEDEAKKATLNLASYRFQSRLTVFAYWCCDRRQRERKALLMSRWVEPIEEENGRCRTEVILDEAEAHLQRNRRRRLHEPLQGTHPPHPTGVR